MPGSLGRKGEEGGSLGVKVDKGGHTSATCLMNIVGHPQLQQTVTFVISMLSKAVVCLQELYSSNHSPLFGKCQMYPILTHQLLDSYPCSDLAL